MEKILAKYERLCNIDSDISQHLPVLADYASKCQSVIEMGFRTANSTIGLLTGLHLSDKENKWMTSIDITDSWRGVSYIPMIEKLTPNNIKWNFTLGDTLNIEIPECDMCFIDTWHVGRQVRKELELHAYKAKKYLGFHDIATFGYKGEDGSTDGLMPPILEFLENHNSDWIIVENRQNNNGLLILERK